MTGGGHVAEPPIGGSVWFLASQGTFTFTLGLVASPPHIFFRMGGGKGRTSRHKHGTQHKTSTLGRHKKKALSPLGASSLVRIGAGSGTWPICWAGCPPGPAHRSSPLPHLGDAPRRGGGSRKGSKKNARERGWAARRGEGGRATRRGWQGSAPRAVRASPDGETGERQAHMQRG